MKTLLLIILLTASLSLFSQSTQPKAVIKLLIVNQDNKPITRTITFVSKSRFSYERSLEEADQALYESKRLGKDRYCYYRDIKKGE